MGDSDGIILKILMANESFALEIPCTSSIEQLKEAIFGKCNLSPTCQQLIFRGKKLESGSLEQNKITKRATLLVRTINSEKIKEQKKGEAVICVGGCGFWGFVFLFFS